MSFKVPGPVMVYQIMHLTDSDFHAKMQELSFEYVKVYFFSVSWQNY